MSRWAEVDKDPGLMMKLQEVYGDHFPIEVRYFLCQWIESQSWHQVDTENQQCALMAQHLLTEMMTQIRSKCDSLMSTEFLLIRMRFESTLQRFQEMYGNKPLEFVKTVQKCLEAENEIFIAAQASQPNVEDANNEEMSEEDQVQQQQNAVKQQILEALGQLNTKIENQERKLVEMQNKQENFIIQYQENVKLAHQVQQLQTSSHSRDRVEREAVLKRQKEQLEQELSQQAQNLLQRRIQLADMFNETIEQLQMLQKKVLDEELIGWKRQQQLAGNGLKMDPSSLDTLQLWCEYLAEIIWNMRQQIKKTGILRAQLPIDLPPNQNDLLPELNDMITGLLSSLVTSTFIVETQPPQVLKKESRFSATVRLLVGGKLNVHMNPPQIKATIISEHQAKGLLRSDMKVKGETSGEILNNIGTMEMTQATNGGCSGYLSAQFRNMQLKRIKRSDKRGSEAVTEEKFCILFQSDFNVGGNDLVFQVWTLSLPVVVTVHGNQECNALATVLWDNAFSEPGRVPFVVPDAVPWPRLGEELNRKFLAGTGRGLSVDNLKYLASKLFGLRDDYNQCSVSWTQFNKDTLEKRNFTFWEWFYAVFKLTKEHLKGPWCDGSIIGFVSKVQAQEWLNQKPNGTFLLRFSDSESGGITIAWIAESNTQPNEREVWNLAPFISRDFVIRSLADRIKDLNNLTFLYPDIAKNAAFQQYYNITQEQPTNGYIRPHLVNVISMPHSAPMADVDPRTPLNYPPPSPAGSVLPQTPQSYTEDLQMVEEISAMDGFPDMLTTDYEPSDIEHINVNQLLQNFQASAFQPQS